MALEDYRPDARVFLMTGVDGYDEPDHGHDYRVAYQVPLPFWVCLQQETAFQIRYPEDVWEVGFDNANRLLVRAAEYASGPPRIETLVGQGPHPLHSDSRGAPKQVSVRPVSHNTLAVVRPQRVWTSVREAWEFTQQDWQRAIDCVNLAVDRYRQAFPAHVLHHAPPAYSFRDYGMLGCSIEYKCPKAVGSPWRPFASGAAASINAHAMTPPFWATEFPEASTAIDATKPCGDMALGLLSEGFAALNGGDTRSSVIKCQSALEVAAVEHFTSVLLDRLAPVIPDAEQRESFVRDYVANQRREALLSTVPKALLGRDLREECVELWRKIRGAVDLRNEVVHEGRVPSPEAAKSACCAFRDGLFWLRDAVGFVAETFTAKTGTHGITVSFMGWSIQIPRPGSQ